MDKRISSLFMNLPAPFKIGFLVLSGGGIITAICFIFDPRVLWILFVGVAFIVLFLLLYKYLLKLLKKRKAAPMERGVIDSASTAPQGISEAAHMARVDDLRKKFEDGIEKFRSAGKNLYDFPWYMIVGEPGSGKTEAIRHCNIGFPPGLQDQFQGAGGTINMNWWFTDHAIILDTAGRLMFEEVETGGSSEWKEFLTILKKSRPRCPINGVFLVIPSDSLIKDTADEIEQKASKIAKQFDVIQRSLDVRFPVFVVITKSDLINGFRDFFDSLEDPQLQHQILGWSNPASLDEPYNTGFIDQHLETIQGRLYRRRLALLQDIISAPDELGDGRKQESDTLYAFPESLKKIAPRMARYLELIFSVGSRWSCKPLFFRGIYFTSSMREGSALDEDLADSLGVPVDSLPDGRVWERDRAYFLRDLFMKKVFREKGLVTHATNANKQHMRRKAAVLLSAAASVILLIFLTVYIAFSFRRSIGDMKRYLYVSEKLIHDNKVEKGLLALNPKVVGSGYTLLDSSPNTDDRDINEELNNKKITRLNFSKKLVDSVNLYDIPWIFESSANSIMDITHERLNEALGIVYEEGVLRPLLKAAIDIMSKQKSGERVWTNQDVATKALLQLIRIKAAKPLNKEGEYSANTFLDPLFGYIFESDPNQNKIYEDNRAVLHEPLGMIYTGIKDKDKSKSDAMMLRDWPPVLRVTDPNSHGLDLEGAIANGIELFNEYWDPKRLGVQNEDYTQVQIIRNLKDAFEKFGNAETRILDLSSILSVKSEKVYTVERLNKAARDFNDGFQNINIAKESIDEHVVILENSQSIVTLWTDRTAHLLEDVNKNYEPLLDELKDVNQIEHVFLGNMRSKLEKALERTERRLTEKEFVQQLEKYNKEFCSQVQRGSRKERLYVVRYEMYSLANEQLLQKKSISNIIDDEVTRTIEVLETVFDETVRNISDLRNFDPDPGKSHFERAFNVSKLALDLAKQRQLYQIVRSSLDVSPKSIEDIEKLIEKEGKWDWADIPTTIIDRRYDPNAGAAILGGWKSLGDILANQLSRDTILTKEYNDANGAYESYAKQYLRYWFYTVPDGVIKDMAKRDSERYRKVIPSKVLEEMRVGIVGPLEGVLTELAKYKYGPLEANEIQLFESNLKKVTKDREVTRTDIMQVLDNWTKLEGNAEAQRITLLKMRPAAFCESYAPFSYQSPVQFVDMYLVKLTCNMLQLLTYRVQDEKTKAINIIRRHSNKFPLQPDSKDDMQEDDFKELRLSFNEIYSMKDFPVGTIGKGEKTNINEVDVELKRLKEQETSGDYPGVDLKKIEQIFRGLPVSGNLCYCRIKLLSERTQRRLLQRDEVLLSDHLGEFRFVQGLQQSERFTTHPRNDLDICTVKYPGPQLQVDFYQYPSSTEPSKVLPFSGPWACLRMLKQSFDSKNKDYIRLNVDKEDDNLGGILYLKLEFFKDRDCKQPVDSSFIEAMTDLGNPNSGNR